MHVYLVDLDALEEAVGSADREFLKAIIAARPNEATWDQTEDDVDGNPLLSDRAALRAVIDGGPFEERHAVEYMNAFETICAHLGDYHEDMTFHHGWTPEVDAAFELLGMSLSMINLRIVWYDTLPDADSAGGGYWTKEKFAEALNQWEATDPIDRTALGRSMLKEIEGYVDWLRESERTSKDIVTFWGG
jgi:hypothetical protein